MDDSEKSEFRKRVRAKLRENALMRNRKSSVIWRKLDEIEAFRNAIRENKLMLYLDFDHEVETTRFLGPILDNPGSKVAIPHCEADNIVPYSLFSPEELAPGHFGILELEKNRRELPRHRIFPEDISVVLVPGLAFDIHGNRLGRGRGYYDRFLPTLPGGTVTIGLAFECQVFDRIPAGPEDRPVSMVVTEERIIRR